MESSSNLITSASSLRHVQLMSFVHMNRGWDRSCSNIYTTGVDIKCICVWWGRYGVVTEREHEKLSLFWSEGIEREMARCTFSILTS